MANDVTCEVSMESSSATVNDSPWHPPTKKAAIERDSMAAWSTAVAAEQLEFNVQLPPEAAEDDFVFSSFHLKHSIEHTASPHPVGARVRAGREQATTTTSGLSRRETDKGDRESGYDNEHLAHGGGVLGVLEGRGTRRHVSQHYMTSLHRPFLQILPSKISLNRCLA